MYSFINDLSISPNDIAIQNNWSLIDTVMELSYQLRDYKIERLRVPASFMSLSIAGTSSIADYLADPLFDHEKKTLLYDFLNNRVEEPDDEIEASLANAQMNKLIDVCLNSISSDLLTESYVMRCPALSFESSINFQVDFLDSELCILNENNKLHTKKIKIENLFKSESIGIHNTFLVEWKKNIVFVKTKWDPIEKPIWNDLTTSVITDLKFPESIHKIVDKKEELRRVGSLVAEINAWIFDENVTKKNKSSSQLRRIFRSDSGSKTAYLSIDFESAFGGFEVHDHKGIHKGQINFLGEYSEEEDLTGHHNIRIY